MDDRERAITAVRWWLFSWALVVTVLGVWAARHFKWEIFSWERILVLGTATMAVLLLLSADFDFVVS